MKDSPGSQYDSMWTKGIDSNVGGHSEQMAKAKKYIEA
jgi:hypothetical protein